MQRKTKKLAFVGTLIFCAQSIICAQNATNHSPVNLVRTIRPELDQLETKLIRELTESRAIRDSVSCRTRIAEVVGKYVSAYKDSLTSLRAIALDRALAAACTSQ